MNSWFLIGAMESLGAQLLIFGTAVYEAGMAYGLRGRANKTIDEISRLLSTRASMLTGFVFGTLGLIGTAWVSLDWFIDRGPFNLTILLILLSYCMLIGYQIVSAGIFLSALKGLNRINIDAVKKEKKGFRIPKLAKIYGLNHVKR
jgi:hypothetical protein